MGVHRQIRSISFVIVIAALAALGVWILSADGLRDDRLTDAASDGAASSRSAASVRRSVEGRPTTPLDQDPTSTLESTSLSTVTSSGKRSVLRIDFGRAVDLSVEPASLHLDWISDDGEYVTYDTDVRSVDGVAWVKPPNPLPVDDDATLYVKVRHPAAVEIDSSYPIKDLAKEEDDHEIVYRLEVPLRALMKFVGRVEFDGSFDAEAIRDESPQVAAWSRHYPVDITARALPSIESVACHPDGSFEIAIPADDDEIALAAEGSESSVAAWIGRGHPRHPTDVGTLRLSRRRNQTISGELRAGSLRITDAIIAYESAKEDDEYLLDFGGHVFAASRRGARWWCFGDSVATDGAGRFKFHELDAGAVRIKLDSIGRTAADPSPDEIKAAEVTRVGRSGHRMHPSAHRASVTVVRAPSANLLLDVAVSRFEFRRGAGDDPKDPMIVRVGGADGTVTEDVFDDGDVFPFQRTIWVAANADFSVEFIRPGSTSLVRAVRSGPPGDVVVLEPSGPPGMSTKKGFTIGIRLAGPLASAVLAVGGIVLFSSPGESERPRELREDSERRRAFIDKWPDADGRLVVTFPWIECGRGDLWLQFRPAEGSTADQPNIELFGLADEKLPIEIGRESSVEFTVTPRLAGALAAEVRSADGDVISAMLIGGRALAGGLNDPTERQMFRNWVPRPTIGSVHDRSSASKVFGARLTPGSQVVRIYAHGYMAKSVPVDIESGKVTEISVVLEEDRGSSPK